MSIKEGFFKKLLLLSLLVLLIMLFSCLTGFFLVEAENLVHTAKIAGIQFSLINDVLVPQPELYARVNATLELSEGDINNLNNFEVKTLTFTFDEHLRFYNKAENCGDQEIHDYIEKRLLIHLDGMLRHRNKLILRDSKPQYGRTLDALKKALDERGEDE